jgi:hypothetical protein
MNKMLRLTIVIPRTKRLLFLLDKLLYYSNYLTLGGGGAMVRDGEIQSSHH